ncbi:MAG: hypothetical protein SVT52_02390 [Planctomycetota bacterium]|nr:hypothetical protein [Planctomycetota bacterium]
MERDERQDDRIARWLDGQDVALTESERAEAMGFVEAERSVGRRLDAAPPRQAMDRARRRLTAELARPRRRHEQRARLIAVAAAAALILVAVAAKLMMDYGSAPVGEAPVYQGIPIETLVAAAQQSVADDEIDMLAGELSQLQAELVVSMPSDDDIWFQLNDAPGDVPEG